MPITKEQLARNIAGIALRGAVQSLAQSAQTALGGFAANAAAMGGHGGGGHPGGGHHSQGGHNYNNYYQRPATEEQDEDNEPEVRQQCLITPDINTVVWFLDKMIAAGYDIKYERTPFGVQVDF